MKNKFYTILCSAMGGACFIGIIWGAVIAYPPTIIVSVLGVAINVYSLYNLCEIDEDDIR